MFELNIKLSFVWLYLNILLLIVEMISKMSTHYQWVLCVVRPVYEYIGTFSYKNSTWKLRHARESVPTVE